MSKSRIAVLSVVLLLVVCAAAEGRENYIVRFAGASVNPTGDLRVQESESVSLGDGTTLFAVEQVNVEADSAFGFCLDLERRVNDLVGVGFTVMRTDHDVNFRGSANFQIIDDATGAILVDGTETVTAVAGSEMTPLMVGANFHFGPSDKVDLYAGPFVGWIFFDDIDALGERVPIEDDWTYGAAVGIDVPFGESKVSFSGSLRYMFATATPDEPNPQDLDLDPWIAMVGVGYRF